MSELLNFRNHARSMATGHLPTCERVWHKTGIFGDLYVSKVEKPNPSCRGECITPSDRDLWTRLADEVDEHLAERVEVDLFGEMTTKRDTRPTAEETR